MRRAAYWIVLTVLVLSLIGTALLVERPQTYAVGRADFGYCESIDYFYVRIRVHVDREKAGYTSLPKYHAPRSIKKGIVFPGSFAAWNETSGFESWQSGTVDYAYWPHGDPGLGSNNPLPPLVERVWRRNINPAHVFLVNVTAVLGWGGLGVIGWWLRRQDGPVTNRRGFDVSITPSEPSPTRRSAPPAPD
jgi:hypothetical protein